MKQYYKAIALYLGLQMVGNAVFMLYFDFDGDKPKKMDYIGFKGI